MQHKNGILAIAVLLGVFSCTHREDDGIQKVKFQAVQADGPSTKTVLQADGSVFWSPGDAVSLFYGGATVQKTKLTAENTSAAAQTTFSGVLDGFLPDGSTSFLAVYPYAAETTFDGSAVTVSVPAEQTAVAGTFASDAFVSIATSKDYTLQFYNLCGGIKFSVVHQGITSVTFRGNDDEILAGQVQAAFDENGKPVVTEVVKGTMELVLNAPDGGFEVGKWYYLVALPTTLSAGYTMTFLDAAGGLVAERVTDTSIAIKRAVWGRLTEADNVGPEEGSIIYYTSTDGNIVSPNEGASFGEGVTLVSNTYENGQGVMQFSGPVTMIGENALRNYGTGATATLKTIVLPETCVAIGEFAFGAQVHLEDVQFPESLRVINLGAFAVCSSLPGIVFPENLEEIYHFAFSNCQKLTAVTIPQSVQLLEGGVFTNCISMEHFYGKFAADSGHALIDGETLLAVAVAGLDSYTVPDGVTAIADYAILNYPNLSEIVLPDGLLSVGNRSICGTDVTNLTIPKSVISLGEEAFAGNTFLESITIEAVMPPASATAMFDDTNDCPIYVPDQSVSVYKAAEYWSAYADRIQPIGGGSTITASKYLTFTSEGTTKIALHNEGGNAPVLYYSTDAQNWTQWDYSELTFSANAPLYICGDNPDGFSFGTLEGTSNKYSTFVAAGEAPFSVSGDVMSLLDMNTDVTTIPSDGCFMFLFSGCDKMVSAPELPATSLAKDCYYYMFEKCSNLTIAPELQTTTLAEGCYHYMFWGCTSLSEAPDLPATTLAENCYYGMFAYCSGLINAPELPATTLADHCYEDMFWCCSSLTTAPELPATTLANECYCGMFLGCTSLTVAPELPATDLAYQCYGWMFQECSNLTTAPDILPATTMYDECYRGMFFRCSNLTNTPQLPAMVMAKGCYMSMFYECSSLVDTPELPATTLAEDCYRSMFWNSPGLKSASALPATTLVEDCYSGMFSYCTSLEDAPELPATALADSCYFRMFDGCTSLDKVTCLATDISAKGCTDDWLYGVASQGTFVKSGLMNDWPQGNSGIPEGWSVENAGEMSIADVYDAEDGATVYLNNVLVYAVSAISFVVGDDNAENFVDVYHAGIPTMSFSKGDRVSVSGIMKTYAGVPEVESIDGIVVNSSNNQLGDPEYIDYEVIKNGQYDRVTPVRATGLSLQRGDDTGQTLFLYTWENIAERQSPSVFLYWPSPQFSQIADQYLTVNGFWLFRDSSSSSVLNRLDNILIDAVEPADAPYQTASILDVLDGSDGEYYKVTGAISQIANANYGNVYLTDDSTQQTLYIYGMKNMTGSYPKDVDPNASGFWETFPSLSENMVITVLGVRSTYNNTIELVDATLIYSASQ